MTSAKYDSLIKSLADLDVALVDMNGEYRATYDIMADIASKWDSMTTMEQAALAEVVAGTRQQAIFFSLIGQFQEASGAMDAMANSANALDDAYSVYLESTTAHINQFKAATQQLSSTTFDSKFMSTVVDAGRAMVEFLNVLVKTKAIIPTIGLSVLIPRFAKLAMQTQESNAHVGMLISNFVKEKAVTDELSISIAGLTAKQRDRALAQLHVAYTSRQLSYDEYKHIANLITQTAATEGLEAETLGLAGSLKAVGAAIPGWGWAMLAFSVLVPIIGDLTSKINEANNSFSENTTKFKDSLSTLEEYKTSIDNIVSSEDDELTKLQNLSDIKEELSDRYGQQIEDIKNETQARENLNKAIDDQIEHERELYLNQNREQYNKYVTQLRDSSGDRLFQNPNYVYGRFKVGHSSSLNSSLNISDSVREIFDKTPNDARGFFEIGTEADNQVEKLKKLEKAYIELGDVIRKRESWGIVTEDELSLFKQLEDQYNKLKNKIDDPDNSIIEFVKEVSKQLAQDLIEDNPQGNKTFSEWRNQLIDLADGNEFLIEQIDEIINKVDEEVRSVIPDVIEGIISDLQRVEGQLNNVNESISTANDYFEDLNKVIKNNNDVDDFFTAAEIIDFLEKYPELYDSIDEISDSTNERVYGYKIEKEALEALRAAKVEEQRNAIIGSLQETQGLANDVRKRLSDYEKELQGIQSVAEAKARVAELDAKIAYANAHLSSVGPNLPVGFYNQQKAKYNAYVQATEDLEKYQKQIETARVELALLGKTNDDAKDSAQDATRALNSEKEATKNLSDELKKAQDSIDDLVKLTMDMIKKEKELQKEALKEQLDNYKKLIDRKKELIDLEKDQYDFQKDLKEQNKDLLEIQQELDALSVEGVNYSLEDMKRKAELEEKYAEQSEKRDDFLYNHEVDVRKDTLDKEKELFEDNINTQTKAIEDYLKHEGWIRQQAIDLINGKSQEFYNDLYNYTLTYTTKSDAEFTKLWNDAYSALEKYGNGQIDVSAVLAYLLYQIEDCDNKIKSLEESMNSAKNAASDLANTIASGMTDAARVTGVVLDNIEAINGATGRTQRHIPGTPLSTSVSSGHKYWSVPDLFPKYHSGGVVKSGGLNNYGEVLAKLMAGEVVITPNQAKNFISKTLPQLTASNITNNQMSPTISIGDINITGNADASTVSQLKEIQKDIVNSVFKAVNGQNNLYNGGKVRMA